MKSKLFNIMVIFICIFVLIETLIKKSLIYTSIIYALDMWVNNLIPALFPFFIISDILINYNVVLYIPKIIINFFKECFNITDNMLTILFLSIISGFPSNARNTRTLYDKGMIDLDEANHILIFSHFSNPIFILTTVGVFFFNEERLGIIILISHYLSNFILGLLFRGSFKHSNKKNGSLEYSVNNFGKIFISSIRKSIDTILLICGILTVFLLFSSIIVDTFKLNIYNSMLIKGLFEITIGIESLGKLTVSLVYKAVIASCFLAFGGLSVHMQVMSQIIDTKIKYRYFFIGRIYQMIISGLITFLICIICKI